MNEISENTWKTSTSYSWWQFSTRLSTTWRVKNLERRKSEYALIESQRELESHRRQLLEVNQWTDQAQRERRHLCSELEMKDRLRQECYAISCQEIEELKRRCNKEENGVTQQKLNECSTQRYQESRSVSLLRDQVRKLQERLEFIEDSKIFNDLTHRTVLAVPTFRIKLSSPRAPGSLVANRECSEIQERIWVFPEAFLIVNLPDECLRNYTLIHEIWQHHREFTEGKELRKVGVKNHCNQYLYLAFRQERGKKSRWQKLPYVYHQPCRGNWTCIQSGMTLPSYPSSEMHLGRFHNHTEFQRWFVNFRVEVCAKTKNPTRALQWIKEIEKSMTGGDFPDFKELDMMMTAALKRCCDTQTHFRRKISVEEQGAQKGNRFLRGRQIACLI